MNNTIPAYDASRCSCGAITIMNIDGDPELNFSMSAETFAADFQHLALRWLPVCCCHCNHCVNHWGIDLCACGSGEAPEKCTEELNECGQPYQEAFEHQPDLMEIMLKRGGLLNA